ncbi:MAG: hypothetical protein AB7T49_09600 [Oligoflexales bacterium]
MRTLGLKTSVLSLFLVSELAHGLPINFGRNQGDTPYSEIKSDDFILYHDSRAPNEGKLLFNSLQIAKEPLEHWIGVERKNELPVISSAVTSNASFANFITDAVELQTMGTGGRDLAFHEYVHSTMYRHLDNWFGPAGSIIHLPWMPAWWIEGLAEALSVSVGSDVQAGIERHQALTNSWPKYAKLHSLYSDDFAFKGYATAGAFVAYLLRTYDSTKLPDLLRDFYHKSMPWHWPATFIPFADMMPMDRALRGFAQKNGEELYEEYKAKATEHWKKNSSGPFLSPNGRRASFSNPYMISEVAPELTGVIRENYETRYVTINEDPKTGWLTDWKKEARLPDGAMSSRIDLGDRIVFVSSELNDNLETRYNVNILERDGAVNLKLTNRGYIPQLFVTDTRLLWLEEDIDTSALCYIELSKLAGQGSVADKDVSCPTLVKQGKSLAYMGQEGQAGKTKMIWLRMSKETSAGDGHQVLQINATDLTATVLALQGGGKPIAMAKLDSQLWLLTASRSERFFRRFNENLDCVEERHLANHVNRVFSHKGGLYVSFFNGDGYSIRRFNVEELPKSECALVNFPTSPLLEQTSQKAPINLAQAVAKSSTWTDSRQDASAERYQQIEKAPPLDQSTEVKKGLANEKAKWRGRSLFAFPWIGADAKGYNFGFISVPLMDHMQNETLRAQFLYGLESRFPDSELMLISNRFDATYYANVFRRQTYNGVIFYNARQYTAYYDEKGAGILRLESYPKLHLESQMGITSSTFYPIIGPPNFRIRGHQNEFSLSLGYSKSFGRFAVSADVAGKATPAFANKTWDYNTVGAGTSLAIPFGVFGRPTTFSLGVSGSRTRGKKAKNLKEVYRPLRTFVPGTGGGLNEINVGLYGPGNLTGAQFGDTQARFKTSWTVPLVQDLETLIHIFYLQRLDFTAFFNYGAAWYQSNPPASEDFIAAHGYNLDLQSDIKGVTVNVGLGVGQVIDEPFEAYFTFGFDALIN